VNECNEFHEMFEKVRSLRRDIQKNFYLVRISWERDRMFTACPFAGSVKKTKERIAYFLRRSMFACLLL